MSADRGEWRGIYTVLQSTPEFVDMPPEAQLCWFHLKLRLGAAGIDAVPALDAVLSEVTGYPLDSIRDGIEILCRTGWLIRQRSVAWLKNGLRFEPSRNMSNANHRTSVENHIKGLPKLKIVNDFAEYYDLPKPFSDPPEKGYHEGYHRDTIADPSRRTEYGIRNTENYSNGASGDAPGGRPSVRKLWPAKPKKNGSGHYKYPEPFEEAWNAYPDREGSNPKLGAYKAFRARVVGGDDPTDLVKAAAHYGQHMALREKEGTPYVQQAATFWGPDEPFKEFVDGAKVPDTWEDTI